MDMVMINDVFRKGVEFAIRKTPTPPETYVEISKKFIDQMIAKVGDGSYAQTMVASPRQAEGLVVELLYLCSCSSCREMRSLPRGCGRDEFD